MTIVLKLRCRTTQLAQYAARFGAANDERMFAIGRAARARGHVTRSEFLALCAWKTPRSKPRCARNTPAAVRSATRLALASPDEHIRVDALRALDGVGLPTASAILHFVHADPYPVLDVRALWSLGVDEPARAAHTHALWSAYVAACRELALRSGLSMRDVDRALWQYSREMQPAVVSVPGDDLAACT